MIKTRAAGMRQGWSWAWLTILVAALLPSTGYGQGEKGKSSATPKKDATPPKKEANPAKKAAEAPAKKDAKAEEEAPAAKADDRPAPIGGQYEVFKDPRAEEAMGKLKPVFRDYRPGDDRAVRAMAAGEAALDTDTIQRFVQGSAFRLTDKSNINALVSPSPGASMNSPAARAVGLAVSNLIEPIAGARAAKNASFLTAYNRELLATLPPLLNNHLISRVQAAIVLGQTGSPQTIPIFLAQLKDPKQTTWVKLCATRGITNVLDGGRQVDSVLSATDAANAARVIVDYLGAEKDLPWPAELRAVEALGALRQAGLTAAPQKAEIATAVVKYLADPDAQAEVRAEAARTLGLFQVSSAVSKYNFSLIAYEAGLLAADLGGAVNASFPSKPPTPPQATPAAKGKAEKKDDKAKPAPPPPNLPLAEYLTGLLVTQLNQAFNGVEGARESGLLKVPAAASSQTYLRQVADLQSSVAKAAVELVRAPNGQIPDRKKDLSDRVSALKLFLDKTPPKDFHLVPGGPDFRPQAGAAVARGAGEGPGDAGGR